MNVLVEQRVTILVFGEDGHSYQKRQDEQKPEPSQVVVDGSGKKRNSHLLDRLERLRSYRDALLSRNLDVWHAQVALDLGLIHAIDRQPLYEISEHQAPDCVPDRRVQVQS